MLGTIVSLSLTMVPPGLPPALAEQDTEPGAVVRAFVAALNAGDAQAAAATFAVNAIQVRAPGSGACSRQSPCVGRGAILARLRDTIAENTCHTIVEQTVNGSVVISKIEIRQDSTSARGVERLIAWTMSQVEDGLITAQYFVNDATDPQTAAFAAIGAGTQPPGAPLPPHSCTP